LCNTKVRTGIGKKNERPVPKLLFEISQAWSSIKFVGSKECWPQTDLHDSDWRIVRMSPEELRIQMRRVVRRLRKQEEMIRDGFKSLSRHLQSLPLGGDSTPSSSKQPRDQWVNTREASKIIKANDFKCSEATVRTKVCKHALIVSKRVDGAGNCGRILISLRSLSAYIEWRKTPTRDYGDIPPAVIAARKAAQAKSRAKREANRKRALSPPE
jgi:hypothetical protein